MVWVREGRIPKVWYGKPAIRIDAWAVRAGGGGQGAVALPHPNRFCRYDNPIQIGVLADYAQPDFQAFLYPWHAWSWYVLCNKRVHRKKLSVTFIETLLIHAHLVLLPGICRIFGIWTVKSGTRTKGQLTSKCLCDVLVSTKKNKENFIRISALSSKKWSNQKNKGTLLH